MKIFKIVLIAIAFIVGGVCVAQVPNKPATMTPIVDMAGIINNDSIVKALNTRLDSLSRRTTNQIVVVTVNDLGNLDANQFATQLGRKWGIGNKKYNNGVVILIKPRNDKGPGEAYISPGPGLEGALPDVECSHIVDSIMVPHLKEGDYAHGIEAAINHIEPIVIAEYEQVKAFESQNNDKERKGGNGWWILGGIAAAVGGLALLRKRNKKNLPQQPADSDQTTEAANNETATAAAAGAASALTTNAQQDEPVEEDDEKQEEDDDNDEDDEKNDEPEPYKYKYGGGDFGGAGAGSKF